MKAINLNSRPYYVTGITKWDDGRVREFDEFKHDPIVCPLTHRYGSEISREEEQAQNPSDRRRWSLPKGCVGYTITYLTCELLTAAKHEVEDARAESHAAEQLEKLDNQ